MAARQRNRWQCLAEPPTTGATLDSLLSPVCNILEWSSKVRVDDCCQPREETDCYSVQKTKGDCRTSRLGKGVHRSARTHLGLPLDFGAKLSRFDHSGGNKPRRTVVRRGRQNNIIPVGPQLRDLLLGWATNWTSLCSRQYA